MRASPSKLTWIGRPRYSGPKSSAVLYRPSMARSSASCLRQKIRAWALPVDPAMARQAASFRMALATKHGSDALRTAPDYF